MYVNILHVNYILIVIVHVEWYSFKYISIWHDKVIYFVLLIEDVKKNKQYTLY